MTLLLVLFGMTILALLGYLEAKPQPLTRKGTPYSMRKK